MAGPAVEDQTATVRLTQKERAAVTAAASETVSDGTLAGSVLELAQTLTKNNAVLKLSLIHISEPTRPY